MKATFYTIQHRGVYIHACYNRLTGREEFKVNSPINGFIWRGDSVRAAKLSCARIVKAIAKGHPVTFPQHMQGAQCQ